MVCDENMLVLDIVVWKLRLCLVGFGFVFADAATHLDLDWRREAVC